MAYENTYAVAVPKKIVKSMDSRPFLTWKKVEGQLKAGFTPEFNDRQDGNKGLQKVYGLDLQVSHHGASPSLSGYPVR